MGVEQIILADQAAGADAEPARYRITVDEFLLLDEAGAFEDVGRVELVDGEILIMSPLYLPHGRAQARLIQAFATALQRDGKGLEVVAPVSARLDEYNLPEADLLDISSGDETWVSRGSVRLAVEVSVTSLRYDLGKKSRLYARSGLPEYWVVDVNGKVVIRMSEPVGETYVRCDEFAFGATIASATIPDLVIDTAALA